MNRVFSTPNGVGRSRSRRANAIFLRTRGVRTMKTQVPVGGPLSEAELDQLSDFLADLKHPDALMLERMDGLFSALIAGPRSVRPSEYLPVIWGGELPDENTFASLENAHATREGLTINMGPLSVVAATGEQSCQPWSGNCDSALRTQNFDGTSSDWMPLALQAFLPSMRFASKSGSGSCEPTYRPTSRG